MGKVPPNSGSSQLTSSVPSSPSGAVTLTFVGADGSRRV